MDVLGEKARAEGDLSYPDVDLDTGQEENMQYAAPSPLVVESPPVVFSQSAPPAPMGSFQGYSASSSMSLGSPILDALSSPIGQKIMYFLLGGAAGAAVVSLVQKRAEEEEEEAEEGEGEEDEEDEELEEDEGEDEESDEEGEEDEELEEE